MFIKKVHADTQKIETYNLKGFFLSEYEKNKSGHFTIRNLASIFSLPLSYQKKIFLTQGLQMENHHFQRVWLKIGNTKIKYQNIGNHNIHIIFNPHPLGATHVMPGIRAIAGWPTSTTLDRSLHSDSVT